MFGIRKNVLQWHREKEHLSPIEVATEYDSDAQRLAIVDDLRDVERAIGHYDMFDSVQGDMRKISMKLDMLTALVSGLYNKADGEIRKCKTCGQQLPQHDDHPTEESCKH